LYVRIVKERKEEEKEIIEIKEKAFFLTVKHGVKKDNKNYNTNINKLFYQLKTGLKGKR
jgi:hypothetical protein